MKVIHDPDRPRDKNGHDKQGECECQDIPPGLGGHVEVEEIVNVHKALDGRGGKYDT